MKYEERRRALHRVAREGNPLSEYRPGSSLPDPRSVQVYGDFWARCAPFLDEVVAAARSLQSSVSCALSPDELAAVAEDFMAGDAEKLGTALVKLDAEASRNPDDSLVEDRRIIFASLEDGDGG